MRYSRLAALLACAALMGGVAACGDDDEGGGGASGGDTETGSTEGAKAVDPASMENASGDVTVCMGKDTAGDIKLAIEEFNKQNNGVTVKLVTSGAVDTEIWTHPDVEPTDYDGAKKSDTARFARFFWAMMDRGVYLPCSQFEAAFTSAAHSDADVRMTVEAAREVLRAGPRMEGGPAT